MQELLKLEEAAHVYLEDASEENEVIPKDTEVIIEKIDGVKAIVKPLIKN